MQLRDHVYIGMTQSRCPECLQMIPAKIISKDDRVYLRKRCPQHGVREDFVCSDVRWYDRLEYASPGKLPPIQGVEPKLGCPYDCGLCTEHEQHTCIGLLEITSSCNLTCPMCYAASAPGGKHMPLTDCFKCIDRLVELEGQPEILQLSGGEPTIHPDFLEMLDYACDQPIDIVMINTNGIRFARDKAFVEAVARYRHRVEVYFQFDGFNDAINAELRGEPLLDQKLKAIEALAEHGINTTLVCTLQPGVNDDQMGPIVEFGLQTPVVSGISFQPATYSGRYFLPEQLESRITFPDVIRGVAEQTSGLFEESDFLPLPCAHPNGHSLSYAYRTKDHTVPLSRFIAIDENLDLLANGITFNRTRARQLIEEYLSREKCGQGGCVTLDDFRANWQKLNSGDMAENSPERIVMEVATEFFTRALEENLDPQDVLRITITSFMDAYNFDVRQVMKSCVHQILPSGHLIPFSAYNVLYRDGHVPLPDLSDIRTTSAAVPIEIAAEE